MWRSVLHSVVIFFTTQVLHSSGSANMQPKSPLQIVEDISALVRRTPPSVMLDLMAGQPDSPVGRVLREIILAEMTEVYPELMKLGEGRTPS